MYYWYSKNPSGGWDVWDSEEFALTGQPWDCMDSECEAFDRILGMCQDFNYSEHMAAIRWSGR